MPHKNPWYIITSEEIARIEGSIRDIRQYVPEQAQAPITGTLGLLHQVQARRP